MAGTNDRMAGSDELRTALYELLVAGRRSVASYRGVEGRLREHRLRAAIRRLREDHERHVVELESVLEALGGEAVDAGGDGEGSGSIAADGGRPGTALRELRRAEEELRALYDRYAARRYAEPVRSMLRRHRCEEEAHVTWLREGRWWRRWESAAGEPPT